MPKVLIIEVLLINIWNGFVSIITLALPIICIVMYALPFLSFEWILIADVYMLFYNGGFLDLLQSDLHRFESGIFF